MKDESKRIYYDEYCSISCPFHTEGREKPEPRAWCGIGEKPKGLSGKYIEGEGNTKRWTRTTHCKNIEIGVEVMEEAKVEKIESALSEPFAADDIEWRVSRAKPDYSSAIVLAYITNRAIMNRLDSAVGISNWKNEYVLMPDGGFLCGLSVRIEGDWITKWDGADKTQVEATKGGLSSAMKRAGVLWGIGRYLYELDETKAPLKASGQHWVKNKTTNKYVYWDNPILPKKFLPADAAPTKPTTPEKPKEPVDPPDPRIKELGGMVQEMAKKSMCAPSAKLKTICGLETFKGISGVTVDEIEPKIHKEYVEFLEAAPKPFKVDCPEKMLPESMEDCNACAKREGCPAHEA